MSAGDWRAAWRGKLTHVVSEALHLKENGLILEHSAYWG